VIDVQNDEIVADGLLMPEINKQQWKRIKQAVDDKINEKLVRYKLNLN